MDVFIDGYGEDYRAFIIRMRADYEREIMKYLKEKHNIGEDEVSIKWENPLEEHSKEMMERMMREWKGLK